MAASLRAACFIRRACVRCPFGNRLVFVLLFESDMGAISSCFLQMVQATLPHDRQRVEMDTGGTIPHGIFLQISMRGLTAVAGERADPGFESRAKLLLIAKLGGNLPKRDSLATFTRYRLGGRTLAIRRSIDDRVMGNRSLAIGAYNLVFHRLSFVLKLPRIAPGKRGWYSKEGSIFPRQGEIHLERTWIYLFRMEPADGFLCLSQAVRP